MPCSWLFFSSGPINDCSAPNVLYRICLFKATARNRHFCGKTGSVSFILRFSFSFLSGVSRATVVRAQGNDITKPWVMHEWSDAHVLT